MSDARELLEESVKKLQYFATYYTSDINDLIEEIESYLSQPEQNAEPIDIEWPEYHWQGMGCGIEDRGITDRYEACRYGWDCAIDAVAEILPEKLYTEPPKREPLSHDSVMKIARANFYMYGETSIEDIVKAIRDTELAHRIGIDND